MVGHFPLTIEVPDAIATQVLNQLFYELPVDDLPRYRERVLRVTPDEIQRVARWFIRPSQLSVVLVGDADKFVNDLKGVGFGSFERIPIERVDSAVGRFSERPKRRRASRALAEPVSDAPPCCRAARPPATCTPARWSPRCAAASPTSTCSASAASGSQAAGGRLVADFHGLSVTGLTEALSVLPRIVRDPAAAVKAARDAEAARPRRHRLSRFQLPPDARIKRLGIPVIYYVSPQLWAWRPGRIKLMKRQRRSRAADLSVRRGDLPAAKASTCASSAIR